MFCLLITRILGKRKFIICKKTVLLPYPRMHTSPLDIGCASLSQTERSTSKQSLSSIKRLIKSLFGPIINVYIFYILRTYPSDGIDVCPLTRYGHLSNDEVHLLRITLGTTPLVPKCTRPLFIFYKYLRSVKIVCNTQVWCYEL